MKTILVKSETHKKQGRVLLEFPFDQELKELIKTLPGAAWDGTKKAWTLPCSQDILSHLLSLFRGKAWLDYAAFRKLPHEELPADLPNLSASLGVEIGRFVAWMQNRRYAASTVKTYSQNLSLFFRVLDNKNPEEITVGDLENFQQSYILRRKCSASFQSQVINAVKLYFSTRLKRKLELSEIERPRQPKLLLHVLSIEEVKSILQAHKNVKHRTMLSLIYACGLRRSELLGLELKDVDSQRGMLRVNQGKGAKDRLVPISEKTVEMLREYYRYEKPKQYLFEGTVPGQPYTGSSLQKVFKTALAKAKIIPT